MDNVHVTYVFCSGDTRKNAITVPLLEASINSVVRNFTSNRKLVIHLQQSGLDNRTLDFLRDIASPYDLVVRDMSDIVSQEGYQFAWIKKLRAVSFVDAHKSVYLDTDTLCLCDISEIYDIPLEGNATGGCIDLVQVIRGFRGNPYINSGMFSYDNTVFRKYDFDANEPLWANKYRMTDQDALNANFTRKILPIYYNVLLNTFDYGCTAESINSLVGSTYRTYDDFIRSARILHFVGQHRPFSKVVPDWVSNLWYMYWPRRGAKYKLVNSPLSGIKDIGSDDFFIQIKDTIKNRKAEYEHPEHLRCSNCPHMFSIDLHNKPLRKGLLRDIESDLSSSPVNLTSLSEHVLK